MASLSSRRFWNKVSISTLFVSAVVTATIPTLAFLIRLLVWFDLDALFILFPATAALALTVGVWGSYRVRAARLPMATFVVAVVLLGLNLVVAALASYTWFATLTCSGGYSGPCFTPFILCGGGLLLDIAAAIFVVIGIVLLRRRQHFRPPLPRAPS